MGTDQTAWQRAMDAAEPPVAETADPPLRSSFEGRRGRLFWLALKTGFWTVLTLGLYRFWMKTRLRRWYWSSVRVGGLPLEYVGDPLEKLLGFLIAVVILAFYIGVVNLLLMFASFALLHGNAAAYLLSFVGVIPLWFYAQYRARRYILARTRWRGMRFGLERGAWGYALRALWHWALTLVTLGLLWPRMTFALEKYKTDRTFFGETRMNQGGRWTQLYPSAKWIFVALGLGAGSAIALATGNEQAGLGLGFLAAPLGVFGVVYYRVDTLRRLTGWKTLRGARLQLAASPMRILWITVSGTLLAIVAILLPLGALGTLIVSLQSPETLAELDLPDIPLDGLGQIPTLGLSIALYFAIFLLWSALTHAFVTMPRLRHYARGLTITSALELDTIRQRPRDDHTEAEGFAEALDVGASL